MDKLKAKSVDEIRALRLSKLESYVDSSYLRTLLVKMSDDSEGKAGTFTFNSSVILDEATIIRKIEVVFHSNENHIWKISFYNQTGLFLELGV
jgi:DNA polymerase III sliding clamp (beta) subunit (PCNA family)